MPAVLWYFMTALLQPANNSGDNGRNWALRLRLGSGLVSAIFGIGKTT